MSSLRINDGARVGGAPSVSSFPIAAQRALAKQNGAPLEEVHGDLTDANNFHAETDLFSPTIRGPWFNTENHATLQNNEVPTPGQQLNLALAMPSPTPETNDSSRPQFGIVSGVDEKDSKGGGGPGGPTDGDGTIAETAPESTPVTQEITTTTPAPIEDSGPSLATILSITGFVASATVSGLAHFTDIIPDAIKEPVTFVFDTVTALFLAFIALFMFGGKDEKNSAPFSEAD